MNEKPITKLTGPFFLSSSDHLLRKIVVERAIAIGGTIPPIITAAIMRNGASFLPTTPLARSPEAVT